MSAKHAAVAAELSWPQVHAFRLQRHGLAARAPKRQLTKVVGAIGGAQAQVMSAAEMQIAVRVACTTADVRAALWHERTLAKTWLMRGTLHLVAATDLPLYAAAMGTFRPTASWLKYFHMTERDLAEFVDTIGRTLSDTPMTKEEIAAVAARGRSKRVAEHLRSGWGSLFKPVARSGLLCFGPNRGTNVTFVRPAAWLRSWREIDPEEARVEVARRYLSTYGPATKADFRRWLAPGWPSGPAAAWAGLESEIVPVSVEGARCEMLARDVAAAMKTKPAPSVQLLPLFDQYLMGYVSRDHLFDRIHRWKVSRVAGWISAVVLVGGRVEGTWTHTSSNGTLRLVVAPFARLSPRVRSDVAERARTLARSMGLEAAEVTVLDAAGGGAKAQRSARRSRPLPPG
ncbi:MAG TPA: winged helix DNA-binding domain-containing protein [Candidatus Limnocylindria bacterium]|nr:winged helix DNA-binding domain-containing protein [Candidatus Limnocylindria bacterium]